MVSEKSELPPSMMMSPGAVWGSSASMKSSTALPALTRSITRRGDFRLAIISSIDLAPTMFVPLASLSMKSSTLDTVRLKAVTVKPWSFMLRMRFWPITASPITAMSEFGCDAVMMLGELAGFWRAGWPAERADFARVPLPLDVLHLVIMSERNRVTSRGARVRRRAEGAPDSKINRRWTGTQ